MLNVSVNYPALILSLHYEIEIIQKMLYLHNQRIPCNVRFMGHFVDAITIFLQCASLVDRHSVREVEASHLSTHNPRKRSMT